jgi:aerobic carbon-monoxide dehydrogenase small subunit
MRQKTVPKVKVNGEWVEAPVVHGKTLLDFIRDDLNLTGTKKGCGTGDCGSCVVLIDGRARTTCRLPLSRVEGQEITTIEGLAKGGRLHPIQEAFIEAGAIQCGYCTPGMVLQAKDLLDRIPSPTEPEIRRSLNSHLCRCTGYAKIVEAINLASMRIKGYDDEDR